MDEKLIAEALRIIEARAEYWQRTARPWSYAEDTARSAAYRSAADILRYAIEGNAECVAQFDYD